MIFGVIILLAAGLGLAGEIHDAARQGDLDAVKALLASDPALIESRLEDGKTVLHAAAYVGQNEIVRHLVQNGADVNAVSNANSIALHGAAFYGHAETVKLLIELGSEVNEANIHGYTPILSAAAGGHANIVEILVGAGADVNAQTIQGATLVMQAAVAGSKETFDLAMSAGASTDIVDNDGDDLLHCAAMGGNIGILTVALTKGFDINRADNRGMTPFLHAAQNGHLDAAQLLIDNGANAQATSQGGGTALHGLMELFWRQMDSTALNVARLLLANGVDVNARDDWEMTPLHRAMHTESADFVRLLLENGAEVNVANDEGITPLRLAVQRQKAGFAEMLLEAGADPDWREKHDDATVLHCAVGKGDLETVNLLLPYVKDVNVKDRYGNTPLYYAVKHGHRQIAQTLKAKGATATELKENYGRCSLLDQKLGAGEAILWYTGHCGWVVMTQNHLLVFDYWKTTALTDPSLANGNILPSEIADKNVEVFISHEHRDHFCPAIWDWSESVSNLTYYLGFQPENIAEADRQGYNGQHYVYTGPRQELTSDGMTIHTLRANDAGVGFLVEVDGVVIYHAGDHAGWREGQRDGFIAEIDYLSELANEVDFAFVNVTGCHTGDTLALAEATFYTLEKLNPKIMVPTHGVDREYEYRKFADKAAAQGFDTKVLSARLTGESYVFKNDEIM